MAGAEQHPELFLCSGVCLLLQGLQDMRPALSEPSGSRLECAGMQSQCLWCGSAHFSPTGLLPASSSPASTGAAPG